MSRGQAAPAGRMALMMWRKTQAIEKPPLAEQARICCNQLLDRSRRASEQG
jgi:hypothetical protein